MKQADQTNRRSRRQTYGFRAITLVIALLACEGALRLLTPPTFLQWPYPTWVWLVKDPLLGWKNQAGYLLPGIEPLPSRINSFGLRGSEFAKEKPEGVTRIICLGDSGTFGVRRAKLSDESDKAIIRFDNDYPGKLASLLQMNGQATVQVLNAGVIGYTSSHGLRQLNTEILDLHPDIITVRFGFNDHLIGWDRSLLPGEPANPAIRSLYYYFLPWKMTRVLLRANQYARYGAVELNDDPWVSVERFEENLHRFAEVGREKGIQMLFFDYPLRPLTWGKITPNDKVIKHSGQKNLRELYEVHEKYGQVIHKVAREEKIPLLETAERLHGLDPRAYGDLDFAHPNHRGSRELSRLLLEKLIELGWIPKSESALSH